MNSSIVTVNTSKYKILRFPASIWFVYRLSFWGKVVRKPLYVRHIQTQLPPRLNLYYTTTTLLLLWRRASARNVSLTASLPSSTLSWYTSLNRYYPCLWSRFHWSTYHIADFLVLTRTRALFWIMARCPGARVRMPDVGVAGRKCRVLAGARRKKWRGNRIRRVCSKLFSSWRKVRVRIQKYSGPFNKYPCFYQRVLLGDKLCVWERCELRSVGRRYTCFQTVALCLCHFNQTNTSSAMFFLTTASPETRVFEPVSRFQQLLDFRADKIKKRRWVGLLPVPCDI